VKNNNNICSDINMSWNALTSSTSCAIASIADEGNNWEVHILGSF
jgi:hypothetical protein